MTISRINPATLYHNPAFSQVITVTGPSQLIFVGGQNGVTAEGKIASMEIAGQTKQAFKNVVLALAAAGATLKDVVKMTIYLVQGQSFQAGFQAVQQVEEYRLMVAAPPTVSGFMVAGLANPAYLVEIEAMAVINSQGV